MGNNTAKEAKILQRLTTLLASSFLPVQELVAAELGCDQPFISRAANGRLIRITPRVTDLRRYAVTRVRSERLASRAGETVDSNPRPGGAETHRRTRDRERGASTRQTSYGLGQAYADEAVKGIHMYLADGYDARLIVEQIAVLRRAQLIRRPGLPRPSRDAAATEAAR